MMTFHSVARRIRERFAGSELAEIMAFELIRFAALERNHDRSRPGWQPHMPEIADLAEHYRELALENYLWSRQDVARFGRPIPRLFSVGAPDQLASDRAIYQALPKDAPYRLDGKIREKQAA